MALQSPLFPIDQPVMPEDRQIGRQPSIDLLERRVEGAVHQWLIGPRRIGKTSVAKAVLARLRANEAVALDVDLSKIGVATPEGLAGEIARQAQAAHVGAHRARRRLLGLASRQAPEAKRLGEALQSLGFKDEGDALAAVSALLAGADAGEPGLGGVLEALALHARASGRRVFLLLDEVHLLAELAHCEEQLAGWAREPDVPIVLVLAGSEESAVQALRDPGRPLAPVGQELHLADIATEDWLHGLRRRFEEASVNVSPGEVLAIVEASDGHPRRTMLIATLVHSAALEQPDRTATTALVELAIQDAKGDRAWT
jgi:Archaeal ATPase.